MTWIARTVTACHRSPLRAAPMRGTKSDATRNVKLILWFNIHHRCCSVMCSYSQLLRTVLYSMSVVSTTLIVIWIRVRITVVDLYFVHWWRSDESKLQNEKTGVDECMSGVTAWMHTHMIAGAPESTSLKEDRVCLTKRDRFVVRACVLVGATLRWTWTVRTVALGSFHILEQIHTWQQIHEHK